MASLKPGWSGTGLTLLCVNWSLFTTGVLFKPNCNCRGGCCWPPAAWPAGFLTASLQIIAISKYAPPTIFPIMFKAAKASGVDLSTKFASSCSSFREKRPNCLIPAIKPVTAAKTSTAQSFVICVTLVMLRWGRMLLHTCPGCQSSNIISDEASATRFFMSINAALIESILTGVSGWLWRDLHFQHDDSAESELTNWRTTTEI